MKYVITIEADSPEELREITDLLSGRAAEPAETTTAPAPEVKSAPEGTLIAEGTVIETETREDEGDAAVDADGMPWNGDYHSDSRAVNADGTWKARRGKSEEAKAARAAFKAGGGNESAPDVSERSTPAEDTGLPGADEDGGLPGAEETVDEREFSLAQVVTMAKAALTEGKTDNAGIQGLYIKASGADTAQAAFEVFKEDAASRLRLVQEIEAL
jgi:hypothetical protein